MCYDGRMAETGKTSLKEALAYESGTEAPAAPILKQVEVKTEGKRKFPGAMAGLVILIIGAGIASGYGLSRLGGGATGLKSMAEVSQAGFQAGDVVGSADEKTFRDQAVGVLDRGGIDGEGSHRLDREGGESQTVYLTSSVVDLNQFVGHKVEVWGETFAAQKAGWLMDVGRVKIVELNAAKPF